MRKMFTIGVTAIAAVFTLTQSSQADLLFYEPFDYVAGTTIGGQTPALGAGGSWTDTSSGASTPGGTGDFLQLTNRANGAPSAQTWAGIPTGSAFPNAGGFLEGQRRDDNEANIALAGSVTSQFTDGSTIWLSFVSAATTNSGGDNNNEINFSIGAGEFGTNGEANTVNRGQRSSGEGVGFASLASDTDSGVQAAYWDETTDGNGNFVLNITGDQVNRITPQQLHIARIDFTATGETITVNVFDLDPYAAPTEADFQTGSVDITTANNLDQTAFDTLSFDAVRSNFDEIRIATTFNEAIGVSAVPEPSSLALLGLGSIGMMVRRKRG